MKYSVCQHFFLFEFHGLLFAISSTTPRVAARSTNVSLNFLKKCQEKKICVVETECPEEAGIAQVFLLLNSLFLPMYAFQNSQTSIMIIGKS